MTQGENPTNAMQDQWFHAECKGYGGKNAD